jgi:hypothetical protein
VRDPHVASLRYLLTPEGSTSYKDAAPVAANNTLFALVLSGDRLLITLNEHFATPAEARTAVEPFLRAWELDVELSGRRGELRFTYEDAEVIDRDPPPAGHAVFDARAGIVTVASMETTAHVVRASYPAPPIAFRASPDVESMWFRYSGYQQGREPLFSMAYFCLTLVESRFGGRKRASQHLKIAEPILRKIGEFTTTRGDHRTARKAHASNRPPSPAEESWLDAAVRLLIRRVGELDAGASITAKEFGDLPPL